MSGNKFKRLLLFTNSFPFGNGEQFISEELLHLSTIFEEVVIFPLTYGNNKTKRDTPKNIITEAPIFNFEFNNKFNLFFKALISFKKPSYFINEFIDKKAYSNKKWLMNWLSSTSIILNSLKHLNKIEKSIDSDTILYFYWGDISSGLVPFIREKYQNLIIVKFHGSDLYEDAKGGYLPYRKQLLNSLSKALFISENGLNYLNQKYSEIPFKSILCRLGVADNGNNTLKNDDIFRIVSCSNMIPLKRINLIIETLKYLEFKIEWTHIGDGPLLKEIQSLSKQLPGNITTFFTGKISPKELIEYYLTNSVNLFINLSETEGIPVSIMEAYSFGIPVFATNVGGVSEIVDDNSGKLLHKDIKPIEIASLISIFKDNNQQEYRRNAKNKWAKFYNAKNNYSNLNLFKK